MEPHGGITPLGSKLMKQQTTADRGTKDKPAKTKPARPVRQSQETSTGTGGNGEDRYEMIRQTAYSFYVARGCGAGRELDDWLQAEAEVNAALARGPQGSDSSTPSSAAA
jgi:hypothetical protein